MRGKGWPIFIIGIMLMFIVPIIATKTVYGQGFSVQEISEGSPTSQIVSPQFPQVNGTQEAEIFSNLDVSNLLLVTVEGPTQSLLLDTSAEYSRYQLLGGLGIFGFALALGSWGMARASKQRDSDDNGTLRADILSAIEENPGIHFRELTRLLNRENGVIQYHLRVLESRKKQIYSHEDARFRRYFPRTPSFQSTLTRDVVSFLQRPVPSAIIQLLGEEPEGMSRGTLSHHIGVSPQAISWNCQKMVEKNCLDVSSESRKNLYTLPLEIIGILQGLQIP